MGLTLTGFRSILRTDLKDSGAVWSDAELDRSIQMAVDDLSRHLPLEMVYEETLIFTITDESFTTPAAQSGNAFVNAQSLSGKSDGDTLTIADYVPTVPRRLSATLTDADDSITELTITVKGCDQDGYYIEESWYLSQFVLGGIGSALVDGNLYFSRIEAVELTNITGGGSGDTLSIGRGEAYDSYVFLANKPIRPESETVTNAAGTTEYTRDTDYYIDYARGAIKYINGGSMVAATAYLIDYTKSRLGLDISSLLPVVTRIQRVNYPADIIPQKFPSYNIIGDFMYIGSQQTGQSQEELTANEHLAIYYERKQFPPGEGSPGSYPDYLDEVVAIGAGGYALLIEAMQYDQQAVTDLASARTELAKITDYVNEAHTQTGTAVTFLNNNSNEDSKYWLTKITTDIAGLRTAILTAVDAANAYLDEVDTTDLGQATVGAEGLLETGDGLIDQVNVGSDVPALYATYSRSRVEIAGARINASMGYFNEVSQRLDNLRTYIEQANAWGQVANGFFTDVRLRLEMAQAHIAQAVQYEAAAGTDLTLADRFRADGTARLNKFEEILKSKAEYRRRTSTTPVKQPA